jgi:hypothetical protein
MTSSVICGENMCARFLDKPTKWYFSDFGRCFGNLDHSTPFLFACFCSCFHFASKALRQSCNIIFSYCTRWRQSCNNLLSLHCWCHTTIFGSNWVNMTISPFPISQSESNHEFFKKILIGFSNFFSSSWSLYVYQKYCDISSHAN